MSSSSRNYSTGGFSSILATDSQMQDSGSEQEENAFSHEVDHETREQVGLAVTRESFSLPIKDYKPANYEGLKQKLGLPSKPVIADVTFNTMSVRSKENREKMIPGYMGKKGSKWNPETLQKERMEEVHMGDGVWALQPKAQAQIDEHAQDALHFFPATAIKPEPIEVDIADAEKVVEVTKAEIEKWEAEIEEEKENGSKLISIPFSLTDTYNMGLAEIIKGSKKVYIDLPPTPKSTEEILELVMRKTLELFKPESTSGLGGEDLVEAENSNADKMRALKSYVKMLQAADETNEVTHAFKNFPSIIADYDDGKDEVELKELQTYLGFYENDLKECDTKIGQAKAVQNAVMEKHYSNERPKKVNALESVKAKIAAVQERMERKARLSQNRSVTPSRKRSRDGASPTLDESPEKKLRITAKKFPLSSPVDVRHSLKDYFNNTDEDLTFTCGKEGFEPEEGKWTEDARKKLSFLEEEVTA